MGKDFPYSSDVKNLVFEGGGVKGIAYLGALKRLYETLDPGQIQGVGGTSAGAITALAISFGLDSQGIDDLVTTLDFDKIRQSPTKADFPNLSWEERDALEAVSDLFGGDIWSLYALFHDYGWYSSDYFYDWLKKQVGAQLGSAGTETFKEYKDAMSQPKNLGRYIDLRVHTTDVSTHETRVLSVDTTPDLEVASAIRMSMSIPFFFQAIPWKGDVYCDGGVIDNYPIDLFGGDHFATLGFHLCRPEKTCSGSDSPLDDPAAPEKACVPGAPVTGIVSYIEDLFESLLVRSSEVEKADVDRTVDISNYCVATTDFSIAAGTADYNGLFNNGYAATDRFLTDWPPSATGGCC